MITNGVLSVKVSVTSVQEFFIWHPPPTLPLLNTSLVFIPLHPVVNAHDKQSGSKVHPFLQGIPMGVYLIGYVKGKPSLSTQLLAGKIIYYSIAFRLTFFKA